MRDRPTAAHACEDAGVQRDKAAGLATEVRGAMPAAQYHWPRLLVRPWIGESQGSRSALR